MKRTLLSVFAVSVLAVSAFAATVQSGLKPGETVNPFQVVDVTGPHKGEQLCYRCQYGANAVVAVFINKSGAADAGELLSGVQKIVDQNKRLRSFVVFMSGPEMKNNLTKIAAEKKITIPLTVLPGGPRAADVGQYEINPEAQNTVLLWKQGTVKANFVNVNKTQLSGIEKAASEMLKG